MSDFKTPKPPFAHTGKSIRPPKEPTSLYQPSEVLVVRMAINKGMIPVIGHQIHYGHYSFGEEFRIIQADWDKLKGMLELVSRQADNTEAFVFENFPGIGTAIGSKLRKMGISTKQGLHLLGRDGLIAIGVKAQYASAIMDLLNLEFGEQSEAEADDD